MKYELIHRTSYEYEGSVSVSHHLARMTPRVLPGQGCPWHELKIEPVPVERGVHLDAFGNTATYFEHEGRHEMLKVTARSMVEVLPVPPVADEVMPWENIRDDCRASALTPASAAGLFCHASPFVPLHAEFADFASDAFPPGISVLEGAAELMHRIFREFRFDSKATTVSTPVAEVLSLRAGVCQDFAHLMLASLRSLGLPARYVSGYLETRPLAGKPRLVGADASHAWVSVFCGTKRGWVDLDPTNNVLPTERHITVAWGRDYSDVSPLCGVTLGAGAKKLKVAVDVIPVDG